MIHYLYPQISFESKELRGIYFDGSDFEKINNFDSGNGSMNAYLQQEAVFDTMERQATTTLIVENEVVQGYFTLKMNAPIKAKIEDDEEEKPFECLELARLATAQSLQGQGIGIAVFNFIKHIAYASNIRFISTMALVEKVDWYIKRGFIEYDDSSDGITVFMILDLFDVEELDALYEC